MTETRCVDSLVARLDPEYYKKLGFPILLNENDPSRYKLILVTAQGWTPNTNSQLCFLFHEDARVKTAYLHNAASYFHLRMYNLVEDPPNIVSMLI